MNNFCNKRKTRPKKIEYKTKVLEKKGLKNDPKLLLNRRLNFVELIGGSPNRNEIERESSKNEQI